MPQDGVSYSPTQLVPLVASWFNFILLTVEIHFAVYYFTWKTRNRAYSTAIFLAVLNDIVATIILSSAVWTMYQTHSESTLNGVPAPNYVWTVAINVVLINNAAILEQCFFVHRYFAITKDKVFPIFVGLLIVGHTIASIWSAISIFQSPVLTNKVTAGASIAASVLSSAADAVITFVMAWRMYRMKSIFQSTRSLFRKIALYCVACGSMTSVATFLNMAFTWFEPAGWIFTIFILGRIYSLSMLVNLVMLRMSNAPGTSVEEMSWTFPTHVHVISDTDRTTPGEEYEMSSGHVSSIPQDDTRLGINYKRPRRDWPGSDSGLDVGT